VDEGAGITKYMEQYISITAINDFLYSPRSLYLHSVYQSFTPQTYHERPQTVGSYHHEKIEKGEYSSATRYIQGVDVYSEEFRLMGKIDIYDSKRHRLIERKTKIKTIHQGHIYQIYAQYFCMQELGYPVEELMIHSLKDNRRYPIDLPTDKEIQEFRNVLEQIWNYDIEEDTSEISKHKCEESIYRDLNY
jgi:CRISPR-associated protein Cas4